MKKKMVNAVLIGVTAMAMVLSGVGCTPKEEKAPIQSEAVKEDPNETAVKELKKYIPKVDRLKVVQNAKNLDMTKAVSGLVDKKQKDKVESVKVDDSKLDETKPGTYEVTVTVTLKDTKSTPDSTKAPVKEETDKTEDKADTGKTEEKDTTVKEDTSAEKDTPVKEETTKPVTPEKEETGKTEDSKGEAADKAEPGKDADSKEETTDKEDNGTAEDSKEDTSKEDNTISGTVDVEIVDKDKAEDLTGKGDVVITDDNKVVESDKKDEDKKEDNKKDEDKDTDKDKNPDADKNDKTDSNSQSSNKPNNNNSGNASTNKPAGNQNQTTTPQHTHNWVQQYTTVYHEEVGHNEQVWVVDSPAWDEPIYENRTICNGCGKDITFEDVVVHSAMCRASYHNENIQVGTTHHEEVGHYENKWVVDSQAWTESVPNGYACSCGATK